jgi:hypothetical protein
VFILPICGEYVSIEKSNIQIILEAGGRARLKAPKSAQKPRFSSKERGGFGVFWALWGVDWALFGVFGTTVFSVQFSACILLVPFPHLVIRHSGPPRRIFDLIRGFGFRHSPFVPVSLCPCVDPLFTCSPAQLFSRSALALRASVPKCLRAQLIAPLFLQFGNHIL